MLFRQEKRDEKVWRRSIGDSGRMDGRCKLKFFHCAVKISRVAISARCKRRCLVNSTSLGDLANRNPPARRISNVQEYTRNKNAWLTFFFCATKNT